jgi:hypothetical protein
VPELVEQALRKAGPKSDNVTVLACRVGVGRGQPTARAALSTTRWATRCSPPPSRPACWATTPADELDDAEIERSIREINEAIQRSSKKRR